MSAVRLEDTKGAVRLIVPDRPRVDLATPRKGADGVWRSYAGGAEKLWIEKSGRRVIEGIASTGTVNSHNYSLDPRGCIVRFPIPLLFRHGFMEGSRERAFQNLDDARIGEVVMVDKRPDAIIVRAIVDDSLAGNAAWERIASGEARCFSGAASNEGLRARGVVDGTRFYDQWILKEVSVCFQGANPDCVFDIVERA